MPHYSEYKCSVCGREFPNNNNLARKKVDFIKLGVGKVLASRTVSWLCIDVCLPKDEDYQRERFNAPGMTSSALERVRNAQRKNT